MTTKNKDGLEGVTVLLPDERPIVDLRSANQITPIPIQWLWSNWLARGKFHVLAGAPGTGKTTLALAIAATLSRGSEWPDGTSSPLGDVVIWSGEDDPADTLVPRLIACGADLSRIHIVHGVLEGDERRSFDPARDVVALRRAVSRRNRSVALLVVDPVVSAVASDSNNNGDVRRALQPIVDLGAECGFAALGITHLAKGSVGRDPLERVAGSLAFGALARLVWVAAKVQTANGTEERVLVRVKSNLGPDAGGFSYAVKVVESASHPAMQASCIEWGEAVEGTARDILNDSEQAQQRNETQLNETESWLKELMAEHDGSIESNTVLELARKRGFSERTVYRARKRIGVLAKQRGYGADKQSAWELPAAGPLEAGKIGKIDRNGRKNPVPDTGDGFDSEGAT